MHHFALTVKDVKKAVHFFNKVCGMDMQAFYWMHGTEASYHIFFKLSEDSSAAIAFHPEFVDNQPSEEQKGQLGMGTLPGYMEHFAFNVGSEEDLLAIQDRIRTYGYQTFGPIDHGMFKSVYVPHALDGGMLMEFATNTKGIDEAIWIDPEVVAHAGFTPEEAAEFTKAPDFRSQGGTVQNPPYNPELQPTMSEESIELFSDPEKLKAFVAMAAEPSSDKKSPKELLS